MKLHAHSSTYINRGHHLFAGTTVPARTSGYFWQMAKRFMSSQVSLVALCVSSLLTMHAGAATATREQTFSLPAGSSITLGVPEDWRASIHKPTHPETRRITFGPGKGARFSLSVVASTGKSASGAKGTDDAQKRVESFAHSLRLFAKEEPKVVELDATIGKGFYFVAIDNAPKQGEYELLSKGRIATLGLVLAFTALAHDQETIDQAVNMLKGARYRPRDAAPKS